MATHGPKEPKDKQTVAVIGAGPTGLTMMKTLREDGFAVTLYERRSHVGGLWAYSENPAYTTALAVTRANISKFSCGFADFPMPDKYPIWMSPAEFQEYMESYASHFDLHKDMVLNTAVRRVRRNSTDSKWLVDVETTRSEDGEVKSETASFDKVAFCHGYQTKARIPRWEGQDEFAGTITHAQAYRSSDPFKDKTVVVVGLGSTTGDVVPDLVKVARKVYVSHRRGAVPARRVRNGTPGELAITWRRRQISQILSKHFPGLTRRLADVAVKYLVRSLGFGKLDSAWRLGPYPNITLSLPGVWEHVIPLLRDGTVTSMYGVKRFVGPKSVEFDDGTVLDDVDALILCTGYSADWSIAPFVETSTPDTPGYRGPAMYRLYMNMFPPRHADSCALLNYSAFGKNNGFSFADVHSSAISSVFRHVERLPTVEEMERHIDEHQRWVAERWKMDPCCDTSMVKQWEFQGFLHQAAGTGMENVGWGWKGWKFWFRDRKMYGLINNGVETAHGFRYFETGRRKTWDGARDAIIHVNEVVRARFPDKNLQ
ncbi:flavin-containing monooxygenase 9 [Coniochaeta sp. 2T2.1]|nr:flavin-containing monooxygenase 9 [Coniochaeta sp. 2T2.1]